LCLGGMLLIHLFIAIIPKVLQLGESWLTALESLLKWQAALAACYIIQLPTMWTYHSQVFLSSTLGAIPI
ncbi:hypothetical protein Pmar_PMAR015043, partial [Perkinsus marinus ATCC 50983]